MGNDMDSISIRAAIIEDLDVLKQFEQGVIAAERPFDDTLKSDPIHYYDLEQQIIRDDIHLVVGEIDGEIIASGYARIEAAKPYVNYNFYSYLGFMFVKPQFRGKGVNQKIIQALIEWSQEQGITMMHLDVFSENHAAISAYKKMGFSANLIEMRLDISN